MKRTRGWVYGVPLVIIVTLMTSCGTGTGTGAGRDSAVPAPSSTSLSPGPTDSMPSVASPTSSTPPQVSCAVFLPSAPCATYASTAGTTGGRELPWVASDTLRVQLDSVDGDLYLTVRTDCAPIGGPVDITGNIMTAGDIAVGALGCPEELGQQSTWIAEFLSRPVEMTFNQGTLQWTSGADTLSFTNADS